MILRLEISNNQKYFGSIDLKNNSISIGKDLSFLLNIDIGDQITIMSSTAGSNNCWVFS